MTYNETLDLIAAFSGELAAKIGWVLQAIGGLFLIYVILIAIRIFLMKKEINMIKQLQKDMKYLKRKVGEKK